VNFLLIVYLMFMRKNILDICYSAIKKKYILCVLP
jgi:hypothetical protein